MHDHPALRHFSDLLAVPSPSGSEWQVAAVVRAKLIDWGYAPETDAAGNVLVRLAGAEAGPLLCLAAHMDEIGVRVHQSHADGALQVERSGGLLPWKLGERPLEFLGDHSTVVGVAAMGAGHGSEGNRTLAWSTTRVITGLSPRQLAVAGIRPGTPGVPARMGLGPLLFGDPADPLVAAWTFDDRMGVVALLRLLEWLAVENRTPHLPTIIAFTVQEEVGGQGAKVLALRERPEIFVAVDGCPIPPETPLAIDGRPGIWCSDKLGPYDPRLIRDLLALAEQAGVGLQPVAYSVSASDASMVAEAGGAARIACFGHVRENSHGYEVARLSVFDHVFQLLQKFVIEWNPA